MTTELVFRRGRTAGASAPMEIEVDGRPVASLGRGEEVTVGVWPGMLTVSGSMLTIPLPPFTLDVKEGRPVVVELSISAKDLLDVKNASIRASVQGEAVQGEAVSPSRGSSPRPANTSAAGRLVLLTAAVALLLVFSVLRVVRAIDSGSTGPVVASAVLAVAALLVLGLLVSRLVRHLRTPR